MKLSTTTLFLLVGVGCAQTPTAPAKPLDLPADMNFSVNDDVTVVPLAEEKIEFYKKAFPRADIFHGKRIPASLLGPGDRHNNVYVQAQARGKTLGYLRDIQAPPFQDDSCPSPEFQASFTFDNDYMLKDILFVAPPRMPNGQVLSNEKLQHLMEIAQRPPKALLEAKPDDAVVDNATCKTLPAFSSFVVEDAAILTRRVAGFVTDTQRILEGAPAVRDGTRLKNILHRFPRAPGPKDELELAQALSTFIPTTDSMEVGVRAFRRMTRAYLTWLQYGGEALSTKSVEDRIVNPEVDPKIDALISLRACYTWLTQLPTARDLPKRCAEAHAYVADDIRPFYTRLAGTLAFLGDDYVAAEPLFTDALQTFKMKHDPRLHAQAARTYKEVGQNEKACQLASSIYLEHARVPHVTEALKACVDTETTQQLDEKRKQTLLASKLAGDTVAPTLDTQDSDLREVAIKFDDGRITVLSFFATWCPHCRVELPRVNEFSKKLIENRKIRDRVRIVGIRTSIERETETYLAFAQRMNLTFEVFTDPVMSLAFGQLAKAFSLPLHLPTLLVLDGKGHLRFHMPAGEFRDTAKELTWAVEHLLAEGGK